MNKRRKAVAVLVSGGVDSSLLLVELSAQAEEVFPVYIRSGYRWEQAELHWLAKLIDALDAPLLSPLIILESPMKDLHANHWSMTGQKVPDRKSKAKDVYLPGRNLLLISKASVFCVQQKVDTLELAPIKGIPFPDASPKFFKQINIVIDEALFSKLKVNTPYLTKNKTEILKKASKLVPLEFTFSCLNPVEFYHCGLCNKCAERQTAFARAGIEDPTGYVETVATR